MIYQFPNGEPVEAPPTTEEPATEEPATMRIEVGVRLVSEPTSLWWIAFDLIGSILFTYQAIRIIADGNYFFAAPWTVLALFMVLELSRDIHGY